MEGALFWAGVALASFILGFSLSHLIKRRADHKQRCPSCRSRDVYERVEEDEIEYGDDPRDRAFIPIKVPVIHCNDCGEGFVDHRGEKIRTRAVEDYLTSTFVCPTHNLREGTDIWKAELATFTGRDSPATPCPRCLLEANYLFGEMRIAVRRMSQAKCSRPGADGACRESAAEIKDDRPLVDVIAFWCPSCVASYLRERIELGGPSLPKAKEA